MTEDLERMGRTVLDFLTRHAFEALLAFLLLLNLAWLIGHDYRARAQWERGVVLSCSGTVSGSGEIEEGFLAVELELDGDIDMDCQEL